MVVVVKDGFGLVSKDKRRRRGAVLTASTSRRATRRSSAPRSSFFLGRGENKSTFCAFIGACSHVLRMCVL